MENMDVLNKMVDKIVEKNDDYSYKADLIRVINLINSHYENLKEEVEILEDRSIDENMSDIKTIRGKMEELSMILGYCEGLKAASKM